MLQGNLGIAVALFFIIAMTFAHAFHLHDRKWLWCSIDVVLLAYWTCRLLMMALEGSK